MSDHNVTFTLEDLKTPERLERVLQQFKHAVNSIAGITPLSLTQNINSLTQSEIDALAARLRNELQAGGSAPLNLQSLLPFAGPFVVIEDTHAQRLVNYPPNNYAVGALFYETDRTVLYILALSSGSKVWKYATGIMRDTFANQPTGLGVNDTGFLFQVSDYKHLVRWTNPVWVCVDDPPGTFVESAIALGTGYQVCDGTTVPYLVFGATITTANFPTPDEVTAPSGVYHKSIAAYTGTINAAVAAATSGSTAAAATNVTIQNESAHTHAVTSPTGAPSATTTVDNNGGGSTVAVGSGTHTHSITSPTAAGSAHNHGITDPNHSHGIGTIVVDATAQPRNMGVLRYFRQ